MAAQSCTLDAARWRGAIREEESQQPSGCELAIDEVELVENQALIYPNPAIQNTQLRFTAKNEWVKVDIYDINQRHVASVYDGNLSEGEHNMPMEVSTLAPGQYMVSILKESGTIHTKLVKVN